MKPRLPYGKSNCRAAANIPSSHGILLTIESRSRPCSQSKRGNQPGRANHGRRTNLSSQPKRGSWGNRPPRRRDPDRATRGPSQTLNNPFSQSGETQMQWGNRANANLQSDGSIPYGSHISQAKYTLPIHTVVQSRTQRAPQERAPNVKQHVWQGLRPEHVRIIQGVPVLLPVPTWALMVKGQSIGESVSVAESLIRHHYATRESLIDFVQTTDVPCRQKCLDVLELVQSGSDSPRKRKCVWLCCCAACRS